MVQEPGKAPTPRPSSTVVMVREAHGAPEIFMVKRHERSSFGAAFAFPGGVLEPADHDVHAFCKGLTDSDASKQLDLDSGGLDYFSAAVRELFEESGVLLGESALCSQALAEARNALNNATLSWDQFVMDNQVIMPCDQLHYFSFWITPEGLPKRYSTRFFLTALPEGQHAVHCGGELTDSCWMPAAAVLNAYRDRSMRVHYPTRKTLERVAEFDSAASLLDWARQCAAKGVVCDQPAFAPGVMR